MNPGEEEEEEVEQLVVLEEELEVRTFMPVKQFL